MSYVEVHCKDCLALLGEEFREVHRWLDSYAKDFPPPVFYDYHRTLLHNSYGLEIIRTRWGEKAYEAGKLHLARDYDDCAPIERLPQLVDKAVVWFNNPENMELMFKPYYMSSWEECLVGLATGERNDEDDDV